MTTDFALMLHNKMENIREYIAEETLHWWRQADVLPVDVDHYKAKEKLMQYLEDIGI